MSSFELNSKQATRLFWFFALLHTVSWTLVPALTRSCYRDDTLEQFTIAREWALASPKHPNFSAWVLETVNLLTNYVYGTPYFVSQMFVLLAVWSVWRIGRQFLSEASALLGSLVFCLFVYCNGRSIEYNNCIALLGLWAFALYCLYFSLRDNRLPYWIGLGLALGAGMNTYFMVFNLCVAIVAFMLWNRDARSRWKGIGPYFGVAIALLCFLPQVLHILNSDTGMNQAFNYGMRGGSFQNIAQHIAIKEPAVFVLSQLLLIFPILLAVSPIAGPYWKPRKIEPSDRFNQSFLLFLTFFPFVFFLVFVVLTGRPLATRYGSQLWSMVGLLVLFHFERIETRRRFLWSVGLTLVIDVAILFYIFSEAVIVPCYVGPKFLVNFPMRELGKQTQAVWNQYYSTPCPYVGGEYRLASAAGIDMSDHPLVQAIDKTDCNSMQHWLMDLHMDGDVNEKGGVIVWLAKGRDPKDGEVDYPNGVPSKLFERYPDAKVQPTLPLEYKLWTGKVPVEVGLAVVPIPNKEPLQPFTEVETNR